MDAVSQCIVLPTITKVQIISLINLIRNNLTWRDSSQQSKSSGALGDLSCHLLDLFCFLAEDTIRTSDLRVVKGTRVNNKSDGPVEVDDNGYVFGRADGGAFFRIRASKSDDDGSQLGLHINLVFDEGEIHYSTTDENKLFLTFFSKLGVEEVMLETRKVIPDPNRELPFWSDSFYYLLLDWCRLLQNHGKSKALPFLPAGLHIQEIIEEF